MLKILIALAISPRSLKNPKILNTVMYVPGFVKPLMEITVNMPVPTR